ncbi:hypothetical protein EGT49_09875 [Companilactobacillus suantsaicola]|uniref:Uncharacterized protein n=1 Tax=Companilactobacillus suantsaicola TaxID=2487723 RepID=A0A4Z0JJR4_9LACO|nr:hypothetical protein EGT49_09875 [Companilactobacillus suantsaicola]
MDFNREFYKVKIFWLGLLGISFLRVFPWQNVCTTKGIIFLIIIVVGIVLVLKSLFNFTRYFS